MPTGRRRRPRCRQGNGPPYGLATCADSRYAAPMANEEQKPRPQRPRRWIVSLAVAASALLLVMWLADIGIKIDEGEIRSAPTSEGTIDEQFTGRYVGYRCIYWTPFQERSMPRPRGGHCPTVRNLSGN